MIRKLGSHVSNKGSDMLYGSIMEALSYQADAFMIYLGAPQNTIRKNSSEMNVDKMKEIAKQNNISLSDIVVHAPYIVNLAQPNLSKRQFAIDFIVSEINKMHAMGLTVLVIHPGAHVGEGIETGLKLISESLKEIIRKTKDTKVIIAIETMAGKGTECCSTFEEIKAIITMVNNPRIKVCFDTCHVHDAGYDLANNPMEVLSTFDSIVGIPYIAVLHLNDSKNPVGSRKDRHENLGYGAIGFESIQLIASYPKFEEIPKILETPYIDNESNSIPPYKKEIEMLRNHAFDIGWKERV